MFIHKIKQSKVKNYETNTNEKPKKSTNKKNWASKKQRRGQNAKEIDSAIRKIKDDEKFGPNEIILKYNKSNIKYKKNKNILWKI